MKLRTQLLLGYALVFALMVLLAVIGQQTRRSLLATQDWIEHTQAVIARANRLERLLVDMETGLRGFVITGDEEFLAPYREGKTHYAHTAAEIRAKVAGNPRQVERLAEIDNLVTRWHHEAAEPELTARREGMEAAALLVRNRAGKSLMDALRGHIDAFVASERSLLDAREREAQRAAALADYTTVGGTLLAVMLGIGVMLYATRRILVQVGGEPAAIAAATGEIARGNLEVDPPGATGIAASVGQMTATLREVARQANIIAAGDYSAEIAPRSERDELGIALNTMTAALRTAYRESSARDWLKTGLARLDEALRGDPAPQILAARALSEIAGYLEVQVGALYLPPEEDPQQLSLVASYAYTRRKNLSNRFAPGEGLVGQAALERQQILVRNVPEDYVHVRSGLGETVPRSLCVTPILHDDRLQGVLEVGTLHAFDDRHLEYLRQAMPALAVAVESAHARAQVARALEESQRLTAELKTQQEELRVANEELEAQARRLEESEQRLQAQQEELRVSNEELEEKNGLLERQKRQVEQARGEIAAKADELALASQYKSEFLANMSHELRTPLNSLLLLAQSLAANKQGNLTADQVESARVIHGSGSDLLNLINEILDLSRIEAGRMDIQPGPIPVADLADGVRASFTHVAQAKGLNLEVAVDGEAPGELTSDRKRLEQILRNLIANAIKFTESGGVRVDFGGTPPDGGGAGRWLSVAVADTGIGIAPDQHRAIFEAFQQGDGGVARRFGGTGLGLTISRELAGLLGGRIQLTSEPGRGATFTLYLPAEGTTPAPAVRDEQAPAPPPPLPAPATSREATVPDDRDRLGESDKVILVVEDDPKFAAILVATCREKGFKCLAAPTGEAGVELAGRHLPSGVILDIRLPGMDGLAVLGALKEDARTRHIPVHMVSADEGTSESLRRGAVGHAVKPLDQEQLEAVFRRLEQVAATRQGRVLVVEDDPAVRRETVALIGDGDARVDEVETGAQALEALRTRHYDCVVLDLGLPDMDSREILDRLAKEGRELPPVIVHTARDLTADEERELREHAETVVIKDGRSPERLLDEVSLFLHRVVSRMPEPKRKMILDLHDTDAVLRDRKVLVVDDDMRTTFAVSRLLAERGMHPVKAENGERALRLLDQHPDTALVLMDIMMPVMDGYETMRRIRDQPRFGKLPIIALTAKAMPEDRGKCLAAGASDYLPKPIDSVRLVSLLRVWLYR